MDRISIDTIPPLLRNRSGEGSTTYTMIEEVCLLAFIYMPCEFPGRRAAGCVPPCRGGVSVVSPIIGEGGRDEVLLSLDTHTDEREGGGASSIGAEQHAVLLNGDETPTPEQWRTSWEGVRSSMGGREIPFTPSGVASITVQGGDEACLARAQRLAVICEALGWAVIYGSVTSMGLFVETDSRLRNPWMPEDVGLGPQWATNIVTQLKERGLDIECLGDGDSIRPAFSASSQAQPS